MKSKQKYKKSILLTWVRMKYRKHHNVKVCAKVTELYEGQAITATLFNEQGGAGWQDESDGDSGECDDIFPDKWQVAKARTQKKGSNGWTGACD